MYNMHTLPSLDSIWPAWLEDCRLDDQALSCAYDSIPMRHRACIKQCMALCQAVFGVAAECATYSSNDSALGFQWSRVITPAPWTVCLVTPTYAAPARLTAAIMPALLARVPAIALISVGGMPTESTRAVLELTGVEDSFVASFAQVASLLRGLGKMSPVPGRCILLHTGELRPLYDLSQYLGVPCWEECASPRFSVDEDVSVDMESLTFAHGEVGASSLSFPPSSSDRVHACIASPKHIPAATHFSSLTLGENMEGCWLHTDLSPAFFQQSSMSVQQYLPETGFFSGGDHTGAE